MKKKKNAIVTIDHRGSKDKYDIEILPRCSVGVCVREFLEKTEEPKKTLLMERPHTVAINGVPMFDHELVPADVETIYIKVE